MTIEGCEAKGNTASHLLRCVHQQPDRNDAQLSLLQHFTFSRHDILSVLRCVYS